jgi:DDE superfamily endonuclease
MRHVDLLLQEGPNAFSRMYRMEYASFVKLHDYISESLVKSSSRISNCSGIPIATEIQLHCCLRWLAGGSYLDVRLLAGISVASFYRCVQNCIHAIVMCKELSIKFPSTAADIASAAKNYRTISNHGMVDSCVGCLDGILIKIQVPSAKEVGNVKSFFSGHYHRYGINVQAVCDYQCRFICVAVAAPGGTNDIVAIRKTPIPGLLSQLPVGYYLIGDNAYIATERLLTPFKGKHFYDVAVLKVY